MDVVDPEREERIYRARMKTNSTRAMYWKESKVHEIVDMEIDDEKEKEARIVKARQKSRDNWGERKYRSPEKARERWSC